MRNSVQIRQILTINICLLLSTSILKYAFSYGDVLKILSTSVIFHFHVFLHSHNLKVYVFSIYDIVLHFDSLVFSTSFFTGLRQVRRNLSVKTALFLVGVSGVKARVVPRADAEESGRGCGEAD